MPPELKNPTPPFKVRWNQVTWYSKLGAIVVFLGVIPGLSFYIGMQYELTLQAMSQEVSPPFIAHVIPSTQVAAVEATDISWTHVGATSSESIIPR